ncbi:DUF2500 domain-containing protein [Peribacillus simplex]|uniref:DUF2500 domain-containing protein n=1 Tax=Peribacillus simplex TaxID=1478 RepID=A0AAW7IK04_9BACI|nr:DUF2500 domain-containing protein [Peribacillus simplex]MDM5452006.1 DUF2500 domain-containing protein [Peribacillus simplex]
MYDVGGSGDWIFTGAPVFIGIIFVIILIMFIVNLFSGLSQWEKNDKSPRLSVPAMVKVKRTNTIRNGHSYNHNNNLHSQSSSTTYYITFEFESGDRSEFHISGKMFGILAEGDVGTLTFQGTRYIDFTRNNC